MILSLKSDKNKIKQLFGQYVPPSYVKKLTDFSETYCMEGETREMTVFADIRDFTTLSEHLEAKEIKRLLNEFLRQLRILFLVIKAQSINTWVI